MEVVVTHLYYNLLRKYLYVVFSDNGINMKEEVIFFIYPNKQKI